MTDNESVFSFVWKIENFSMIPHQFEEILQSPTFVVDAWEKVEFYLRMYPRGRVKEGKMSLFLYKKPEEMDLKLNFNLAVESTEPSEQILGSIKDHVLRRNWGFPEFVSIDDIYAKTKHYLPQDTLTLRCEISPAEETSTEHNLNDSNSASTFLRKHCFSRTCIEVQRRSITWMIRNVKERIQRPEKEYILLASFLENASSLKLTLNFNKNGDYFPISINQTCLSSQVKRLFVKCKITVTSATLKADQVSKTSSHLFTLSTSDVWSFPPFITTSILADKKYLNQDGKLILRCEFFFSYKDDGHHSETNYSPRTFETRQKNSELGTCFENIYSSRKFCDVKLKAGGKTFPYYKLVLCARSSVFSSMFEIDMTEKNSNVVEIEDVDPETLQRMLTYMHSDVLQEDLSAEDACSLYRAADKYDLESLKKWCSVLLGTTVSVQNVCDLLDFADAHQDSSLMTAISDFVCNHTTEVFHSAQWDNFMKDNPKLSCFIMHKMWIGMH